MRDKTFFQNLSTFRFNSIFFSYWSKLMVIVAIPFIGLTLLSYSYFDFVAVSDAKTRTRISMVQTVNMMNNLLNGIQNAFYALNSNADVIEFLATEGTNNWGRLLDYSDNIHQLINNTVRTSGYIDSIHIYNVRSDYVLSTTNSNHADSFVDKGFIESYRKTGDATFIIRSSYNYAGNHRDILTVCYGIYGTQSLWGLAAFNIDVTKLGDLHMPYNDIFLIQRDASVIYASQVPTEEVLNMPSNSEHTNDDKFYLINELEILDLRLITVSKLSAANPVIAKLLPLITVLTVLIISVLVSFLLSKHFYNSMCKITVLLQQTGSENHEGEKNELMYITNNIMRMMRNSKTLEENLTEKIIALKKSQNIALQTQMTPHFLFNTLNIVGLTVTDVVKAPNDAEKIIRLLSDLLYYSLNTKEYMVELGTELDCLDKYIKIEQIKRRNAFDVDYDIAANVTEFQTVKFTLQPIVENAFEHGINRLNHRRGRLGIKATIERGDTLVFVISDNGNGMDEEYLLKINTDLAENRLPENNQIGLYNVNYRIKLICGEDYGCCVESSHEGTCVTVKMPAIPPRNVAP